MNPFDMIVIIFLVLSVGYGLHLDLLAIKEAIDQNKRRKKNK